MCIATGRLGRAGSGARDEPSYGVAPAAGALLQAPTPAQATSGRIGLSPAGFVGVDGPLWFLRAVLGGRAAFVEDSASALLEVVRSTVVVRGDEAMAPRELLTLKLPDQTDSAAQDAGGEERAMASPSTGLSLRVAR